MSGYQPGSDGINTSFRFHLGRQSRLDFDDGDNAISEIVDCFKEIDLQIGEQEISVRTRCDTRRTAFCLEIECADLPRTFQSHDMPVSDGEILQPSEID